MTARRADDAASLEGRLHSLTERKAALLDREFAEFQAAVSGEDADLAAPNRRRAATLRRLADGADDGSEPVVPGVDLLRVREEEDTPLTSWWAQVPVYDPDADAEERLWCPACFRERDEALVREAAPESAAVVRREDDWAIVVQVDPSSV